MARRPKPWYWKARKTWCVYHKGEKLLLGPDRAEALRQYHQIMAEPEAKRHPIASDAVAAVFDDFLTWTQENRAEETYRRYKDFIQSFCSRHGRLAVSKLNAGHVTAWLNTQTKWNSTTKHNAITALKRGLNWAVRNRGLDRNPILGMEKPEAKRRTAIITTQEFDELLAHIDDDLFRDFLIVCYDCGSRPQEAKQLEARHIDIAKHRAVIPGAEAKGGLLRAIYFPTDRSLEIIRNLVNRHPSGPLFRNKKGNPWTAFSVKLRFERLQIALGRLEMARRGIASSVTDDAVEKLSQTLRKTRTDKATGKKRQRTPSELRCEARQKLTTSEAKQYAKRFRQYDLRHAFITRKLRAGVDSHIVAALAGHKDTKMIDSVYSHVADDHKFMLEAAKKDI